MGRRWQQILLIFLLALVLVGALFIVRIQVSPWYVGMGDDSGFFAVGGQRMLSGDLLYRDVWDTKPPGVFYLNAFAISIGGSSPWAIWWLETVWIAITIIALILILSKLTSILPAFLATILFTFTVLHPALIGGGNFTEIYAQLPIVLTLGAAIAYFSSAKYRWILLTGALTATAFMFKQNTIALGVASLAVALLEAIRLENWRKTLKLLGAFVIGFLPLLLLIVGYWAQRGALGGSVERPISAKHRLYSGRFVAVGVLRDSSEVCSGAACSCPVPDQRCIAGGLCRPQQAARPWGLAYRW